MFYNVAYAYGYEIQKYILHKCKSMKIENRYNAKFS